MWSFIREEIIKCLNVRDIMLRLERTEGVFGPTIQGEGIKIGVPVTFVRLYGCDGCCNWCDTPHAVPSLNKNTGIFDTIKAEDIYKRIEKIGCKGVVISGGNPLIFGDKLVPLLLMLLNGGYDTQIETQGSIKPTPLMSIPNIFWSVSPKLPSAGKRMFKNWKAVQYFLSAIPPERSQFKFVVADIDDYTALKERLETYPLMAHRSIILQPEGLQNDRYTNENYAVALQKLCIWVSSDVVYWSRYSSFRVLPQLHKIIWQREKKR